MKYFGRVAKKFLEKSKNLKTDFPTFFELPITQKRFIFEESLHFMIKQKIL